MSNVFMTNVQQEKEILDDLSTELELTDEDKPVLYAVVVLPKPRS